MNNCTEQINVMPLFSPIDSKLIELLKSLSADEWFKPTIARLWNVKDVAAHLLDGNLRGLSFGRDGHSLNFENEINSHNNLIDYLNELNAVWVKASKRLSTNILIELLEISNKEYFEYLKNLNPEHDAIFPVGWAGETKSKNWFHIAREYTEKWIHQQQIREAVSKSGIMTEEFYKPMIKILMLGLPNAYKDITAEQDETIKLEITSDIGMKSYLRRDAGRWILKEESSENLAAEIIMDPDTAWKLFTKSLRAEDIKDKITINGDSRLIAPALGMISVMA